MPEVLGRKMIERSRQTLKKLKETLPWIILGAGFFIIFLLAKNLLGDDFTVLLQWSAAITLLGLIFYPITGLIFHRFYDGGWLFSKTIGIACGGWLVWYLSSTLFSFSWTTCIISALVWFLINLSLFWILSQKAQKKNKKLPLSFSKDKLFHALSSEFIFFTGFVLWTYLRGFKPEAYGTEKFMDYGFMTAILRSKHMPPQDLWFAGETINYYYVGQFLASYLTRLCRTTANYGYNLMLTMLAAFGFALPYSIACNVAGVWIQDRKTRKNGKMISNGAKQVLASASGIVAGVGVSLAGNLHYPIYARIKPWIQKIRGEVVDSYWFPNATRYIGYNPDTEDKTIHEFPSYSFVLGDLHAHVINIIFVLTVLALLFAWLLYRKETMDKIRNQMAAETNSLWTEAFHPVILFLGFFIGLFQMTNFWDFPIYFVVSGAIILFSNAVVYQFSKKTILLTAIHAAIILGISTIVCLPFTLTFHNIFAGIALTVARTPLYQLAILWGLPVLCVAVYLIFIILAQKKEGVYQKEQGEQKKKNWLFRLIEHLSISDLFILTIGLCGIGLVLLPEVIYVIDIYSGSYKRANTMFKLTYQAFILFGISMSFIFLKLICFSEKKIGRLLGGIGFLVWLSTVPYISTSCKSWFGNVKDKSGYQGIDAAAFVKNESEEDAKAVDWLNEHVKGNSVILEAPGDSYTYYERISVLTGLSTIMGWKTHEWLWRSDETGGFPASAAERQTDAETIYTSKEREIVEELLKKYQVEYIYIGGCEREKYGEALNEMLLKEMGTIVYPEGDESYFAETYIIKVNQ